LILGGEVAQRLGRLPQVEVHDAEFPQDRQAQQADDGTDAERHRKDPGRPGVPGLEGRGDGGERHEIGAHPGDEHPEITSTANAAPGCPR
jgi:hypothetical protein